MKVWVEGFGTYSGSSLREVTRVTKTMIMTTWGSGEKRFRRRDGMPVGWDGWSGWCIRREDLEKLNAVIEGGNVVEPEVEEDAAALFPRAGEGVGA
jgi:putative NADPH-quinone reductase